MKIGFTSTQEGMTKDQRIWLNTFINDFKPVEFHHGDCIGSDSEAHELVKLIYPECKIIIHPPLNKSKRAFNEGTQILKEKKYLERNKNIVNLTDILIGTPKENEEILRSGTWSTIRFAKKRNKSFHIILPNGKIKNEFSYNFLKGVKY